MKRWGALAALLLAVAGALALRCPKLDTRPLHNDEAVNALKVSELWQHGRYRYDPDEFHGPTLYYASLPFLWLSGARSSDELTEATLRLAPVVFGTVLILLLLLLADGLGRLAIGWAAIFTAVSPAMVFYSRYFIHEMLLVFFTALTIGAGWRYSRTGCARWAIVAGVGIGLMCATKETFIITLAAMGGGGILTVLWGSRRCEKLKPPLQGAPGPKCAEAWPPTWSHVALASFTIFLVWLMLFSSFFTNFGGLADSIRTYLPWLRRAAGASPHLHPWHFYLERLAFFHPAKGPIWSEGLILVLAAVGVGAALFGRKSPLRQFLTFYTIILTAAYSMISYKTPWCLLSFLHGMILLAGIGAATLVEFCRRSAAKIIVVVILAVAALQLSWQAWRATSIFFADRRNPYVYAQTLQDIFNLVERVEAIARITTSGHDLVVKVIAPDSDYGPLPWYLRQFKNVGWWGQLPADPYAPLVIASSKLTAALDEKSNRAWVMVGLFELRPGNFMELYVERELWGKFVSTLPREKN